MSEILIKERIVKMDSQKLFKMVEDLSYSHFAKIIYMKNEIVKIKFYTRPSHDYTCSWNLGLNYFNKELSHLFHKNNSIGMIERKEQ